MKPPSLRLLKVTENLVFCKNLSSILFRHFESHILAPKLSEFQQLEKSVKKHCEARNVVNNIIITDDQHHFFVLIAICDGQNSDFPVKVFFFFPLL